MRRRTARTSVVRARRIVTSPAGALSVPVLSSGSAPCGECALPPEPAAEEGRGEQWGQDSEGVGEPPGDTGFEDAGCGVCAGLGDGSEDGTEDGAERGAEDGVDGGVEDAADGPEDIPGRYRPYGSALSAGAVRSAGAERCTPGSCTTRKASRKASS